ncbi:hypothetical protein GQR58_012475 [Nymphon striatum]|nr:hypothetical protein GQR58_012475 [Nymphon striatum]
MLPELERTALNAVIDLVGISQLVDLSELLEHRVVEESVALFNSNGTYRKTQKSQLIQKLSLQPVDLQEPYIALIDMGMIWRMAIPSAEDRQTQDGTPYMWLDYVHKLSSIILARHGNAERIICVNDPYDAGYSTKDDERDLRVQGNTHVPKIYMKYLTGLAPSVDAEIIYSVGSNCMNLSTQQSMQNYSFHQSEADTVLFSAYAVLRESSYTGPVVIDATDTDAYVAAAFISQKLPGMLCIKRKQETIICSDLVTDEMARCIAQLHCMTGCDANSSFYGKGKKSVNDQMMKSPVAQRQLSRCGDNLDIDEKVPTPTLPSCKLLGISCAESLLETPPSPIGHGWELVDGRCRPVRHTQPALPKHLPAPGPAEANEEDESDYDDENDDDVQENIALNKPVYGSGTGSKVTDGDHFAGSHNNCAWWIMQSPNQYLCVDLKGRYVVSHGRVLSRQDGAGVLHLKDFSISVGDKLVDQNTVKDNALCQYISGGSIGWNGFVCNSLLTGRYVAIYRKHISTDMVICEMEIFGKMLADWQSENNL